jgi:hypothetical protein
MTDPTSGEFPAEPVTDPIFDPAHALEGILHDPVTVAELGAYDGGQLSSEQLEDIGDQAMRWSAGIRLYGASMPVMREIMTNLVDLERRHYPGAPIWDRVRGMLAQTLYEEDNVPTAAVLVFGMRSPNFMAQTVVQIEGGQQERPMLLADRLMQLSSGEEDPKRRARFPQAMLDFIIEVDPDQPTADMYESYLLRSIPGYSPLDAWIDSQRTRYEGVDWDAMTAALHDDARWHGVSMRWRQHVSSFNLAMYPIIMGQVSTEAVLAVVEKLDDWAERFPKASAWDTMRCQYASALFKNGDPLFAMDFARGIREPRYLVRAIKDCIELRYRDEASELSARLSARLAGMTKPAPPEK